MKKKKHTPLYLTQSIKVIDKWLEYKRFFERIPGLTVGIVYKDNLVFSNGYGYKNLETKEKMSADACFRIASISKVFTATAIMRLVETGKLSLEDEASRYLSWLSNGEGDITIRQLLSHSSGVKRDGNTFHWFDDIFPNIDSLKNQAAAGFLTYSPGDRYKYSNLGFSLLGAIINEVSGQSYEDYVKEIIIRELGLKNTFPDYDDSLKDRLANGYSRDIPGKVREVLQNPKTNAMASATGFVSNAPDLCTFLSAQFLDSNKLISDESKQEMQKIQRFNKGENMHYGLGFEIWKSDKMFIVGHGGAFSGFRTKIGMDKERKIGVVILTNATGTPTAELINGVFHIISYFRKNKSTYKPDKSKEFGKYAGLYRGRWGDVEVFDVDGHLIGVDLSSNKPLDKFYNLESIESNRFRIKSCDAGNFIGEEASIGPNNDGAMEAHFGPSRLIKSNLE